MLACGADEALTLLGDDDWFAIDVEAETKLLVMTRGQTARAPVTVTTSTGDRVLAEGDGVALQLLAETPSLGEGRYLIHVVAGDSDDAYALTVTCESGDETGALCAHTTTTSGTPWAALVVMLLILGRARSGSRRQCAALR